MPTPAPLDPKDHTLAHTDLDRQRIWDHVAHAPIHNLWNFQGVPPMVVIKRTFNAFNEDNLLSRAAELGYYFLFALFPTLLTASAIFGLVIRNGDLYVRLLNYLSLVVPPDALKMILETFHQTSVAASGGKLIFGIAAALWSASVGFSAIQDTLNIVYKVKETRPYWKVKGSAILVTVLLSLIIVLILSTLLAGTFASHLIRRHTSPQLGLALGIGVHILFDVAVAVMLIMLFALIYYFAPDIRHKRWRWFTPGSAIGILGWFLASVALRVYISHSNSYTVTYGSLGAVIILLTWFYITGLMLLLGAEINSEIEAAAAETILKAQGTIPPHASVDPDAKIQSAAHAA